MANINDNEFPVLFTDLGLDLDTVELLSDKEMAFWDENKDGIMKEIGLDDDAETASVENHEALQGDGEFSLESYLP